MSSNQDFSILFAPVNLRDEQDRTQIESEIARIVGGRSSAGIRLERRRGQLVLSACDELQLEEISKRVAQKTNTEIGDLQVAFRETIRKASEGEGKYIRQTGGSGNYGHCWLRVEPNEPGKGYEFINEIKGGVVPKEYIKPIDQGVQGAMEQGVLAGFQVVDVKVSLFDGSYHEVDSNENAFKIAGSLAFKEAVKHAKPVLLEPVMAVEVTVPEEFMGTIIGDINSRRGRIEGMEHVSGSQVIKAMVPLKEMFGYVNDIRSSTQGRASYSMQFARYEEAPRMIADEIIGRAQGK